MLICKAIIILPVLSFTPFYRCWENGLILDHLLGFQGKGGKKMHPGFTVKRANGLLVNGKTPFRILKQSTCRVNKRYYFIFVKLNTQGIRFCFQLYDTMLLNVTSLRQSMLMGLEYRFASLENTEIVQIRLLTQMLVY